LDFDSLDGRPVNLIFVVISPPDQRGDHLRALEMISRHLERRPPSAQNGCRLHHDH
jgi:mannitol/fructose-specific phosphotransferase system IIA component (Ntr-type)